MDLGWIQELDDSKNQVGDALKEHPEIFLLYQACLNKTGMDLFLYLYQEFLKCELQFREKPILKLKKIYVEQNSALKSTFQLAKKLNVSDRTIYGWLREFRKKEELQSV